MGTSSFHSDWASPDFADITDLDYIIAESLKTLRSRVSMHQRQSLLRRLIDCSIAHSKSRVAFR